MNRRNFLDLTTRAFGLSMVTLLPSCWSWWNDEVRKNAKKSLAQHMSKPELTQQELIYEIKQIFIKNNIPGYIADNFNGLTIWVSHWSTSSTLPKAESLQSEEDVKIFERIVTALKLLWEHKDVVFVVEWCDFRDWKGIRLWKINRIWQNDCLTPPSIKQVKNAVFTWVDWRSERYWEDILEIIRAFEEYKQMIEIDLWVPIWESYSPISIINSNTITWGPNSTIQGNKLDELINVLFTLWRVVIESVDSFENEMQKINEDIIKQGKFPVFIVGSTHVRWVNWSYVLWNTPDDVHWWVVWLKKNQYFRHIIKKHIEKHWNDFSMYTRKPEHARFKKYLATN